MGDPQRADSEVLEDGVGLPLGAPGDATSREARPGRRSSSAARNPVRSRREPVAGERSKADEAAMLDRFREYRATGDRGLRNELVEDHRWLAVHCARRFARRGEPVDDLVQVAQLGVVKAVNRFDPDRGANFATFAIPTVLGELRRHFRDATWAVRVPRRTKELHLEFGNAVEALSHQLGRPPTIDEIARWMRIDSEDVLEAIEAGAAYRASPLQPVGESGDGKESMDIANGLGGDDARFELTDRRLALRELLDRLQPRERRIVYLRFFEEMTQSEIAEIVGMSQVHVSRLLRASLRRLREAVESDEHDGATTETARHDPEGS